MAPFLVNALIAGLGLAVITAPLGCLVVWRRLAYMGETIAQAGLIGIAIGLLTGINQTAATLAATATVALALGRLAKRTELAMDSLLGMMAHALLAGGIVLTSVVRGGSVDLMGFLFGDIFAVTVADLVWVVVGGSVALAVTMFLWRPLIAVAVHDELAAAEGIGRERLEAAFLLLLAFTIAVAIKIVGVLLAISFLLLPAVTARRFAATPEAMAGLAALTSAAGVLGGLWLSFTLDVAGGPAIVLAMATIGAVAVALPRRSGA
jgi:zinc transport system permease protein